MKYAREILGLMRPYPGRQFRMAELVRGVNPMAEGAERQRIRNGVLRVLAELEQNGSITRVGPAQARGGYALYSWKVPHEVYQKCHLECHNSRRTIAP
ncbi:hypothetical protein D0846_17545 [Bordetella avium]|nr:hypothetical protein D0432_16550 [Bordetella avium]UOK17605.1 hypothetical protein vBBaMIFTN9_64 [Bordetella phage vB_BaM-IFTN9]RIQ17467.1 hypothetical protein D0850_11430 [Bordetella avium]RIQ38163.1 hypothetical protein D0847_17485 [Bordetella avium]RIQ38965.1 hypothetical protein D0846_17545 [Bordetella avium]